MAQVPYFSMDHTHRVAASAVNLELICGIDGDVTSARSVSSISIPGSATVIDGLALSSVHAIVQSEIGYLAWIGGCSLERLYHFQNQWMCVSPNSRLSFRVHWF